MSEVEHQIIIVPCSGIGKTFGEVTRQAAYEVAESLRPDETRLAALSLLVMGDEQAQTAVAESPVLAIDGCRSACATKMVRESGAAVTQEFVVLDAYRRHRQFKPRGISKLNEGGQQLAHALAEEIAAAVDSLSGEGGENA